MARKYEETHPWLKFNVDFRKASWRLWVMLGECQSKCEHIAGVPLRPRVAEMMHRVYLAKGSLATTAIEGNTMTEEEVLQHLEGSLELSPSREYLEKEVENIISICNDMGGRGHRGEELDLTPERIMELNARILDGLEVEDYVVPGRIRREAVTVARYRAVPAEDCEYLLGRLCEWLGGEAFDGPEDATKVLAILKAIVAHLYLAWIHPFGDGNGRTARAVEFQILFASGIPAPACHLLSNHYNNTRTHYYRELDKAGQRKGDVLAFVEYAVQGLLDGLKAQLKFIMDQQMDVAWRNYVHESFRDLRGDTNRRRRHLVLDLSRQDGPVKTREVMDISPRVAREYAGKTSKTLTRDLNAVAKMGLVQRRRGLVSAAKGIMRAFLPTQAK